MSFSFRVIKILSRNFSVSVPLMRYCNTFPDFIALVWNHLTNEYFRISEIRLDMSPKDFFETKKGEKIQYAQYYLDRWGMKINDLDQPLLVSIPGVSKKNVAKFYFIFIKIHLLSGKVYERCCTDTGLPCTWTLQHDWIFGCAACRF